MIHPNSEFFFTIVKFADHVLLQGKKYHKMTHNESNFKNEISKTTNESNTTNIRFINIHFASFCIRDQIFLLEIYIKAFK
jgi:hypothetical protein